MSALQKYKKIAQEAEAKLAAKDKVIEDLRDRLQYCGQERDALFLLESCNLEDAAEFLERFKKAFPGRGATSFAMSTEIEILSGDDVAAMLGVNRKTVYEAADRGEIPHRRLGRRVLFERGAILAWIRGGERATLS